MPDDRTPLDPDRRALLAVYEDRPTADAAVRALHALRGPGVDVLVGEDAGIRDSLLAEMQQEANDGFVSPQVGVVYSKESLRSSALLGPPLIALTTLLFLPLGLIPVGDAPVWLTLLAAAVVGAFCGGAILLVAGPAMGVKRSSEPLAAQRGIAVRLDGWSEEAERVLVRDGLIRLDVVDREGRAAGWTVASQDTSKGANIVDELRRNATPADDDDRASDEPAPDRTVYRQS